MKHNFHPESEARLIRYGEKPGNTQNNSEHLASSQEISDIAEKKKAAAAELQQKMEGMGKGAVAQQETTNKTESERQLPPHVGTMVNHVNEWMRMNDYLAENQYNHYREDIRKEAHRVTQEMSKIGLAMTKYFSSLTTEQRQDVLNAFPRRLSSGYWVNLRSQGPFGTPPTFTLDMPILQPPAGETTVESFAKLLADHEQRCAQACRTGDGTNWGVEHVESTAYRAAGTLMIAFSRATGTVQGEIRRSFPVRMNLPEMRVAGQPNPMRRTLVLTLENVPNGNLQTAVRDRWENAA